MTWFVHVDLDAFYASVEQLDHPELKGKPVIVGGLPGSRRGVVSTASYEARAYGVHSAMPIGQAYRLCPDGIYLPVRMKRYQQKSAEIMRIFSEFSPDVQQISVDEAFVDISGTERLFGPPEQTAQAIQTAVRERTGLTASIGLASNKYLAKIASGMSKPNGFCMIPAGSECAFMQRLPLNKVWGVGEKTLAKLHKLGLHTTADVYNTSFELLAKTLGNACANFLFAAVRGQNAAVFSEEAKTHSVSAESTYEYDLCEPYAIETALMELCCTVMFRMYTEGWISRTVQVKIRYDDFSTVSVQETSQQIIANTEDMFARAKTLLHKKYSGGSIRLLGAAALNLERSEVLRQGELFDFGSAKAQKLEQAVFNLKQKNPRLKITKARLLQDLCVLFLLPALYFFCSQQPLAAETMPETAASHGGAAALTFQLPPPSPDTDGALFSYSLFDTDIEFFMQGYWDTELTGSLSFSFGGGSDFAVSTAMPVFKQEVDLSVWLMLNKQWYFEAAFAEQFEKNTFALGYTGENTLRSVRIANRGILFPSFYPADALNRGIGGGDNQAPGISASFAGKNWRADAAVRYEALTAHEKIFYGSNEVSEQTVQLTQWERGRLFFLPSVQTAASVTGVYVESENGTLRDREGRTYRKLDTSEYQIAPQRAQLVLAKQALITDGAHKRTAAVLLRFSDAAAIQTLKTELGTFSGAGGNSFLSDVQQLFLQGGIDNIAAYSYGALYHDSPAGDPSGNSTDGFFTNILGTQMLVIQHPAGFSPFSGAYRYASTVQSADEVQLVSQSTDTRIEPYAAAAADSMQFVSEDFLTAQPTTYIEVYSTELDGSDGTQAAVRFPLAARYPQYYLQSASSVPAGEADAVIKIRSYSPVDQYYIGTDAAEGTVSAYRNGIRDSGAEYNAESGVVTLSAAVSAMDRIRIVWYEDSNTADTGAIAAAAGIQFFPFDGFSLAASLTSRWAFSPHKQFADAESQTQGFAALAGAAAYEKNGFKAANTIGLTVDMQNTSGYYRILGMDDHVPQTAYLTQNAAFNLPDGFIPSIEQVKGGDAPNLAAHISPIEDMPGITDEYITGYATVLAYDLPETQTGAPVSWTARSISLGNAAAQLASASQFSIALKDIGSNRYDVYLQLGVPDEDSSAFESKAAVPTWKIGGLTDTDISPGVEQAFIPAQISEQGGWQTVTVNLTDADRARLAEHHAARLIIVNSGAALPIQGELLAGPYEITTQGFSVKTTNAEAAVRQTRDNSLPDDIRKRFNPDSDNAVQQISWTMQSGAESKITLQQYIAEVDISPYRMLHMYVRLAGENLSSSPAFSFSLDRHTADIVSVDVAAGQLALHGGWQLVSVNLDTQKVYIDGAELIAHAYSVSCMLHDTAVRFSFSATPTVSGTLYIDEVYLSETSPQYLVEDSFEVSWQKDGVIAAVKDFALLEDAEVKTEGTVSVMLPTAHIEPDAAFTGKVSASVTVAGLQLSGDAAHASGSDMIISDAGHAAATTSSNPLFRYIQFSEQYRYSETSAAKQNAAGVTLAPLNIPVTLTAETQAKTSLWQTQQKMQSNLYITIPFSPLDYTIAAQAAVFQETAAVWEPDGANTETYGESYLRLSKLSFSRGEAAAASREFSFNLTNAIVCNTIDFIPQASFSADGQYANTTETLYTHSAEFQFLFPFAVQGNQFSISWQKETDTVHQTAAGGNYAADISELFDTLGRQDWFFAALPFYDMFDAQLPQKIAAFTKKYAYAANGAYNTTYRFSWQRNISANRYSFFIPTAAEIAVSRNIRTAQNIADAYQTKLGASFAAFNCFGSFGIHPVFSWYQEDEYMSSYYIGIKIPRSDPSLVSLVFSGYAQAVFYIEPQAALKAAIEFQFEELSTWNGQCTAIWERTSTFSPITALIRTVSIPFYEKIRAANRTDSINYAIDCTDSAIAHTIAYDHKLTLQLGAYFSVSASLGAELILEHKKAAVLTLLGSIGGTVIF